MNRRSNCPHCRARASVHPPSPWWRVAVALAWAFLVVAVLGASLIGPLILVVGPVLALSGACLLSVVHTRAAEPATCEACGKIVDRSAPATPAQPRPASGWSEEANAA